MTALKSRIAKIEKALAKIPSEGKTLQITEACINGIIDLLILSKDRLKSAYHDRDLLPLACKWPSKIPSVVERIDKGIAELKSAMNHA